MLLITFWSDNHPTIPMSGKLPRFENSRNVEMIQQGGF